MQWTPETLADACGGTLLRRSERPIAGAFIDTRAPLAGGLFVPIVAARDGHDFIQKAIDGGASAVLVARGKTAPDGDVTVVEVEDTLPAFWALARDVRERFTGPVVAVAGSNGKTTTRAMIEAVLKAGGHRVLSTRGNLNNHLGVPLTLCGEPHDPTAMVIEVGMSAPGENDLLGSMAQPTVAVITSIALEHVEFLGTLEAIAAAEAEIVEHIREGGALVIPGDEPLLAPHLPAHVPTLTFGPGSDAYVRIEDVAVSATTRAQLAVDGTSLSVTVQLFGAHNARNAAAAAAVGAFLEIDADAIARGLESVRPVGDRGLVYERGPHLLIADCYNANPGSMEAALRSLAELRGHGFPRIVAVLGDMLELGPTTKELHRQVGELAGSLGVDQVIGVGELSQETVTAAQASGSSAIHVSRDDVSGAAQAVVAALGEVPTAVLFKGSRGIALERVIEAVRTSEG